MSEAIYFLWQAACLGFWFWLGSFVARDKTITEQWSVEWMNRAGRYLAVPVCALLIGFSHRSASNDESFYDAPDLTPLEEAESKAHHQAIWMARSFAGFCGALLWMRKRKQDEH
jgi:hypothetical protein